MHGLDSPIAFNVGCMPLRFLNKLQCWSSMEGLQMVCRAGVDLPDDLTAAAVNKTITNLIFKKCLANSQVRILDSLKSVGFAKGPPWSLAFAEGDGPWFNVGVMHHSPKFILRPFADGAEVFEVDKLNKFSKFELLMELLRDVGRTGCCTKVASPKKQNHL